MGERRTHPQMYDLHADLSGILMYMYVYIYKVVFFVRKITTMTIQTNTNTDKTVSFYSLASEADIKPNPHQN